MRVVVSAIYPVNRAACRGCGSSVADSTPAGGMECRADRRCDGMTGDYKEQVLLLLSNMGADYTLLIFNSI